MQIMSKLANSIHDNIQTSFDVPSDFPNKKMPYLDTQLWMEYDDENYPQGKAMFQHFVKPMATRLVVENESAIGEREKRTIHTQELIRVMRNCHEDLPQEEVNKCLEDYMKKLQNSGYDQKYRKEILASGKNGFQKQKKADKDGKTPLYRPKGYQRQERATKKKASKRTFFRLGGYDSYIMVPATKDSKLKKTIDEKLKRLNLTKKVKIIEKPGPKFFDKLKILNRKPKINNCKDPNCLIQKTQNGGNCKINEIVYSIICKECGDRYTGETSRNGHSRSIEHVKDAKSENKKKSL